MRTNRTMFATLMLLFAAFSCKKQDSFKPATKQLNVASHPIKRWLESKTASSGYQKFLADGKLIDVPQQINWESTTSDSRRTNSIIDVRFLHAPQDKRLRKFLVTRSDANGDTYEGNYYIVVTDKASESLLNEAERVLELLDAKRIPVGFKGAVIRYDLNNNIVSSKHYEFGKEQNKADQIAIRKGKKQGTVENTAPAPEGCSYITIEWYWQVFENGVLVYEEYLYSSEVLYCSNGGGGGNGGGNPIETCNQQFNTLVNSASVSNISEGKILLYETNQERSYTYQWKCLVSPGGWYVRSYDIGTQERGPSTNWEWHWKSIVHSDISVIGIAIGGTVAKDGPGTGVVTSMGNINAHYSLSFVMKYSPGCAGLGITLPSYSIAYSASTIFSVFPYAGGPTVV